LFRLAPLQIPVQWVTSELSGSLRLDVPPEFARGHDGNDFELDQVIPAANPEIQ
jgi:hypothetical protein